MGLATSDTWEFINLEQAPQYLHLDGEMLQVHITLHEQIEALFIIPIRLTLSNAIITSSAQLTRADYRL